MNHNSTTRMGMERQQHHRLQCLIQNACPSSSPQVRPAPNMK